MSLLALGAVLQAGCCPDLHQVPVQLLHPPPLQNLMTTPQVPAVILGYGSPLSPTPRVDTGAGMHQYQCVRAPLISLLLKE